MSQTTEPARLITGNLFAGLLEQAERSPRKRTNFNFHDSAEDPCHRFLNVMLRGTYITPHRHLEPLKPEGFLILEGRAAFFIFDDAGEIVGCHLLDAAASRTAENGDGSQGSIGIDVAPGAWHSMVVLSPHVLCYETKPGPYAPPSDKEFASFAPREGEPGTQEFLARLETYARERFAA